MEETNNNDNIASNVAQAIATALDWTTAPDARRAAVSYLESIKGGDVRALATTSFPFGQKGLAIRNSIACIQNAAVRLRWDELSPAERRNFANVSVDLMSEIASPSEQWALKSQAAALVAEIVRREGINLWQELFPSLVSLSSKGPIQAELVSMTLRSLPEDITVHNEDLEGDRRRLLLRGLTQSLPEIFPLLYHLLETHFGAAVNQAGLQQLDVAKQHAATVTVTLNAINAYAEWALLPDLAKHGIIHGADLIGLCREIFIYLCDRDPTPRQILLSLPCIMTHDLAAFEEVLGKTSSPKEQKQHMKSLLLLATGNNLRALAAQKSVNVIADVSTKPRGSVNPHETKVDEGESIGLAAIL